MDFGKILQTYSNKLKCWKVFEDTTFLKHMSVMIINMIHNILQQTIKVYQWNANMSASVSPEGLIGLSLDIVLNQ